MGGISSKEKRLAGQHVVITGGSAGIGLALARLYVATGCKVSLVARSKQKLGQAKEELLSLPKRAQGASVQVFSADVTDFAQVAAALQAATQLSGPIDVLVCNAGSASPGYFHEQGVEVFEQQMRLNYLGAVNTVKAAYDGMVRRGSGHICLVASTMAIMGFVGYSSYAPSKWAVRGLADCLRNELLGSGVRVSIALPPDTETPGYAEENRSKPQECSQISESSSVFSPDQVARCIYKGMLQGRYILPNPDLGIALLSRAAQGLTPRGFPGALLDVLLGPVMPLISAVVGGQFDSISRKGAPQRFAGLR